MAKMRTIGTLIIAALIGLVSILLVTPKKSKKSKEDVAIKEQTNLFV